MAGCPDVRRPLIAAVVVGVAGLVAWAFVGHLETAPRGRNEPAAIILRPPEGFEVRELGASSYAAASVALAGSPGVRTGVRFTDDGDDIILLANRDEGRLVEMRAARSGTIVERTWSGDVERRLAWAAERGNLDAPGLPPPTGKNLYH
jgi:hypothetical protein